MFKDAYVALNEKINPNSVLVENTIQSMNAMIKPVSIGARLYRNPLLAAALIVLCIMLALPALAANVPEIHQMMYLVSPEVAQFFMPVQKTCESNGIRMEVVSAYIHDVTSEIYITMQDLTGDRIDSTADLFDSYSVYSPFASSAHCTMLGYDDETKTATFLVQITEQNSRNIKGGKVTFSVRNILSGKREYNDVPIQLDLQPSDGSTQSKSVNLNGAGGDFDFNSAPTALVSSGILDTPVKGIDITAIGYVNDKLHVQFSVGNTLIYDNHGFVYLKGKDGSISKYLYSINFSERTNADDASSRMTYIECVFDVSPNQIMDYQLFGSFFTSDKYTEGDWKVTFPLDS